MFDFAALKKSSGTNLATLAKAAESMEKKSYSSGKDTSEYWKCDVDKSKNGYAVIRFLYTPKQDIEAGGLPWVKFIDHGFQGPGGWYIEKSLSSLGQDDPMYPYLNELWNSGLESDKEIYRKRKGRTHYVSNIYVVKDQKHPENEGKVFKWEYGPSIFKKVKMAMEPEYEDDVAIDPFDLWNGANFKLKIREHGGFQNYDLSEFSDCTPISTDDAKVEEIWDSCYSLLEILNPKNFKSFAELQSRMKRVLGGAENKFENAGDYNLKAHAEPKIESKPLPFASDQDDDEDDEDLSYFSNLVGED